MARVKQYGNRVNVLKYIKAGASWRFAAVVENRGKVVRDHVLLAGQDEHHAEGTYYMEWYENANGTARPSPILRTWPKRRGSRPLK